MPIVFKYKHVQRKDDYLKKAPFIPIYLRTKDDKLIESVGLLDSGADFSVIPLDLAQFLGLKLGKEDTTGGIGGNAKVRKSQLRLTIKKGREHYNLTIPVLVILKNYGDIPILLGRNGFFDEFHILFKQDREKITLNKVQPRMY